MSVTLTADRLLAAIQARGVRARDQRVGVHEASHALTAGARDWSDREVIHAALVRRMRQPSAQVREEIEARATEWEACERFGIPYEADSWALNAALEAIKCGISMPLDAWTAGIRRAKAEGMGRQRLDALIEALGVTS